MAVLKPVAQKGGPSITGARPGGRARAPCMHARARILSCAWHGCGTGVARAWHVRRRAHQRAVAPRRAQRARHRGLGRIGREIADRLAAFKCELHYHARSEKETPGWRYHADPVALAREAGAEGGDPAAEPTPAEQQDTLAAQEEAQQDDTSEALDQDDDQPPAKPFVFVSRNSVPGPEAAPEAEAGDDGDTDASEELVSTASDLGAIDGEALRDMVVEIVREELQGALGERITRNVRRLVRREIHRALASQELD